MPIQTAIWRIGPQPQLLPSTVLATERLLEDMIVAAPNMLSEDWMLIGRQEDTGFGGRIDLLAIAPDGSLVLIELKRDRTPRDVVAQSLDYASWVEKLRSDDISSIYSRFAPEKNLATEFKKHFGQDLVEGSLNQDHQIVIVSSSLDDSTERIVGYLSERKIAINVLCFQVFSNGPEQFISRAWLLDPIQTQAVAATSDGNNEPWNGEFYASFGQGPERDWGDAVQYGFICAGGGIWFSRTLQLLKPGDRVWVNAPGRGYVGVGRVSGRSQPAATFMVKTQNGDTPILNVATNGSYHRELVDNRERCEYFVPVKWLQTVSIDNPIYGVGLFGNQNTVCKPTAPKWRSTVDRLKKEFRDYDKQLPEVPAME
ncbi:endonuclease NucS domain-containing protein [Schlesneria sp.]|uniref:endonuclease NucS domain-containing protein n=1 Tax=Schlesneria sp. TaxID=2762018 RepID=UPI003F810D20